MITPEQYQQQVQDSYRTHIVGKLRTNYPSIANDASDDELLHVWHRLNIPDADQNEAEEVLRKVYGEDWTPPEQPKPTLGDRAQMVGEAVKEGAQTMAPFLGAATLPQVLKVAKPLAGSVGQVALAGNTAIRLAGDWSAGKKLEKTATDMPIPDIADLKARGYSDQQIHNIVQGYTATQESLMKDVSDVAATGMHTAAEGIANAAFLPIGGSAIAKSVEKATAKGLTNLGVKAGMGRVLSTAAGHGASGAAIGAGFMGTLSAVDKAAQAKADGGGADDIYKAVTSGIGEGVLGGALFGGGIGLVLGTAGAAVGEKLRRSAARQALAAKAIADAQDAAVRKFGDDFKPQWLQERFAEDLKFANENNLPDAALAANIATNIWGPEILNSETGVKTILQIAERIGKWRSANAPLLGKMLDVPAVKEGAAMGLNPALPNQALSESIPNIASPAATDLAARGGVAPENLPPAIQTPPVVGERPTPFVPPTELPQPVEGLAKTEPGVKIPPAAPVIEGLEPTVAPRGTLPTLQQPIDIEPGGRSTVAEEINPKDLGPSPVTPRMTPNELVLEPLLKVETAKVPEPGLRELPTLADEAVAALKDNPTVSITPGEGGKSIKLEKVAVSANQLTETGASAKALEQVAAEADQRGLPIEARLTPTAGPRGGMIPLDKLLPWYEKQGYKVVEKGENYTVVRREPIPVKPTGSIADRIDTALSKQAEAAAKRIRKRGVRLSAGIDPEQIADYAVILTSKMFTAGLRGSKAAGEWLVKEYGEAIAPHVEKIYEKARKNLLRMFKTDPRAKIMLKKFDNLHRSGAHGMNWYEETSKWVKENFGDDADMFLNFLGVTSADSTTEAGTSMALKAYSQWKSGLSFTGFRSQAMVQNLERVARGEEAGGLKISNFIKALKGDPNAIVLDRWMIRALGFKTIPSSLSNINYKLYSMVLNDLAAQAGLTPRQFQAAIWEGMRVEALQARWATHGAPGVSKVGSARPFEYLVSKRLGGLTPVEYVKENQLSVEKMSNLYTGLNEARKNGGFTFNVDTYGADKTPGYVTTLASIKVPRKEFYPEALINFKKQFEEFLEPNLLNNKHMSIGVWKMDPEGKHFTVDLNVVLNNKRQALKLGLANRQFEIGHISETGEYKGFKTGYDPAVHGKQFLPPRDPMKQKAWFAGQRKRVATLLDKLSQKDQEYHISDAEFYGTQFAKRVMGTPEERLAFQKQIENMPLATQVTRHIINTGPKELRPVMEAVEKTLKVAEKDGWEFDVSIHQPGKKQAGNYETLNATRDFGENPDYFGVTVVSPKNMTSTIFLRGDKYINGGSSPYITAHELVHQATSYVLYQGRHELYTLQQTTPRTKLYLEAEALLGQFRNYIEAGKSMAMRGNRSETEKVIARQDWNVLDNPMEFITFGLSHPDFQALLDTIPSPGGTLWTKFVNTVRKALNLPPKANTMLSKVLSVGERTMKQGYGMEAEGGLAQAAMKGNQSVKTMEKILANKGQLTKPKDATSGYGSPQAYWLSPDGKLYGVKSHEGVSSVVGKALKLSEKKIGYKGTYRWDNHAMMQNGYVRIQLSGDRMSAQIVQPLTDQQKGVMRTMGKERPVVNGVVTSYAGDSESPLYETLAALLKAASKE